MSEHVDSKKWHSGGFQLTLPPRPGKQIQKDENEPSVSEPRERRGQDRQVHLHRALEEEGYRPVRPIVLRYPIVPEQRQVAKQTDDGLPEGRPRRVRASLDPGRIGSHRDAVRVGLADEPGDDDGRVRGHDQTADAVERAPGQLQQRGLKIPVTDALGQVERVDEAGEQEEHGDGRPAADAEAEEGELEEMRGSALFQRGGMQPWGEGGADMAGDDDEARNAAEALVARHIKSAGEVQRHGNKSHINPVVFPLSRRHSCLCKSAYTVVDKKTSSLLRPREPRIQLTVRPRHQRA